MLNNCQQLSTIVNNEISFINNLVGNSTNANPTGTTDRNGKY